MKKSFSFILLFCLIIEIFGAPLFLYAQTAIPLPVPQTPSAPQFTNVGTSSLTVLFKAPDSGGPPLVGLSLYRVLGSETTLIANGMASTTTQYVDTGLTPNTLYVYYVKANNAYGTSTNGEVSGTTTLNIISPSDSSSKNNSNSSSAVGTIGAIGAIGAIAAIATIGSTVLSLPTFGGRVVVPIPCTCTPFPMVHIIFAAPFYDPLPIEVGALNYSPAISPPASPTSFVGGPATYAFYNVFLPPGIKVTGNYIPGVQACFMFTPVPEPHCELAGTGVWTWMILSHGLINKVGSSLIPMPNP